jgi:hypothetical protein
MMNYAMIPVIRKACPRKGRRNFGGFASITIGSISYAFAMLLHIELA